MRFRSTPALACLFVEALTSSFPQEWHDNQRRLNVDSDRAKLDLFQEASVMTSPAAIKGDCQTQRKSYKHKSVRFSSTPINRQTVHLDWTGLGRLAVSRHAYPTFVF
jgi:hypothetical protein